MVWWYRTDLTFCKSEEPEILRHDIMNCCHLQLWKVPRLNSTSKIGKKWGKCFIKNVQTNMTQYGDQSSFQNNLAFFFPGYHKINKINLISTGKIEVKRIVIAMKTKDID